MPDEGTRTEADRLPPIHPGEILTEEFVKPHGLTLARVARDLGVNTGRIGDIAHGRGRITAEMALRLGKYFGTSAEFWLGLQMEYDMRKARRDLWPAIEPRVRSLQAA
jgi:addiction module HigA family antidote